MLYESRKACAVEPSHVLGVTLSTPHIWGEGSYQKLPRTGLRVTAMNRAKLKALVHYIVAKSDPSRLGAIRLNKILWYLDTISYRADGASITGETYIKRQHGPVPAHILSVIGDLEHENAVVVRNRHRYGFPMTDYIAVTDPDLSALSPSEIEMVDDIRALICDEHTAMSISELSHTQVWEAANIGEEIPMQATLASSPGEVTADLLHWADGVRLRYEATLAA